MKDFLKRLFGSNDNPSLAKASADSGEPSALSLGAAEKDLPVWVEERRRGDGSKVHTAAYFKAMAEMQQAVSARQYDRARKLALDALDHLAGFVDEHKTQGQRFAVQSIPALETGGLMFALFDDREAIDLIGRITGSRKELEPWREIHTHHEESRVLFRAIETVIAAKPGVLQNAVKGEVSAEDGRRVSTLITWLEKAGRIRREQGGKTYALYPLTPADTTVLVANAERLESRTLPPHRHGPAGPKRDVAWSMLQQIALPRAPSRWEVDPQDERAESLAEPFALLDSTTWTVVEIQKLSPSERPDPAFRKLFATGSGMMALDDLGKSAPRAPAAALRYGRDGRMERQAPLAFGVYRFGVSSMSGSFIALSRDHVAHAYDQQLNIVIQTDLALAPEIIAIRKRLGIDDNVLHTHLRTVALADDSSRYLFTAVDEAWCVNVDGVGLWGIQLPLQDGVLREDIGPIGTRRDIQCALDAFGLVLPLTQTDIKQQYRALAREWHPDVNRSGDATSRMQKINEAFSLLTGLESDELEEYAGATTFYKEMSRSVVRTADAHITLTVGISMSETSAADWIYAAAFAAETNRVYVATYSGRVLEVSESGEPVRYYDIGNVPRRIVDTGDFLYFLTDTRLYVLSDGALRTLIDTTEGGDLIVTQNGFGLLEPKRLRWYDESGKQVATVLAKAPIRRVYQAGGEVLVETRTHRLRIAGAQQWWDVPASAT